MVREGEPNMPYVPIIVPTYDPTKESLLYGGIDRTRCFEPIAPIQGLSLGGGTCPFAIVRGYIQFVGATAIEEGAKHFVSRVVLVNEELQ